MNRAEEFMAKVWLITGASRGLGRAFTEAILEAGDRVVATARNPEQLVELQGRYSGNIRTVALDVTNEAQAKAAFVVTRKLSRNGLMEAPEWLSKVPTKVNSLRAESPVSDRIDAPSVFVGSPRFSVDKRNCLEARVIVTTLYLGGL
jgi:NAD(P)-dependent dehydrogenase (short-subunit alcohol dehydrogenase family)